MNFLYVALGGALGAMARYGAHWAWAAHARPFPWSTLWINVSGSGLAGFLGVLWMDRDALRSPERLLVMVGFLGAFTTFSTFAGESAALARGGQWGALVLHGLAHNGLSWLAAVLGGWCAWQLKN